MSYHRRTQDNHSYPLDLDKTTHLVGAILIALYILAAGWVVWKFMGLV